MNTIALDNNTPWKPSVWQKLKSQFMDVPLEEVGSPHNPKLQVSLSKGRIQLGTDNAIYSYEDRYITYRMAFEQLKPEGRRVNDVLVLGFGMGSIPILLGQRGVQCRLTGVDIDETVLLLAKKYIHFPEGMQVMGVAADAADHVQATTERYDIICIDLFLDDQVPHQFETPEFLEQVKQLLQPNGLVLFNRLYYRPAFRQATDQFFHQVFKRVFPEGVMLHSGGNRMLVNHL